uniref:Cnidarian restricted protein n=1 Tax=Clytia hemisphaerica TaxID=252671 RepID=A0A7M5XIN5_9CNID
MNFVHVFVLLVVFVNKIESKCDALTRSVNGQYNSKFILNLGDGFRSTDLTIKFVDVVQNVDASHSKTPNAKSIIDGGKTFKITGGFSQRRIEVHVKGYNTKLSSIEATGIDCNFEGKQCKSSDFGAAKCERMLRERTIEQGKIQSGIWFTSGNDFRFGAKLTFGFETAVPDFHAWQGINRLYEKPQCQNIFHFQSQQGMVAGVSRLSVKFHYSPPGKLVYIAFGDVECLQVCGTKPDCLLPTTPTTTTTTTTTTTEEPKVTTEPEVTTEEPEATTEQPEATTEQPEVATEQPEVITEQPEVTTEQPEVTTEQPEVTTEEPEVTTEQPEVTTEQPEVTTGEPEVTTEQPEATTEQPEATTEQPEVATEQPEVTTEKPEVTTEEPEVTTEEPEQATESTPTTTTRRRPIIAVLEDFEV